MSLADSPVAPNKPIAVGTSFDSRENTELGEWFKKNIKEASCCNIREREADHVLIK